MAVLKYKDSSGNWIEVGSNTEASGGGKTYYRHVVSLGMGGPFHPEFIIYSSKSTAYSSIEEVVEAMGNINFYNLTSGGTDSMWIGEVFSLITGSSKTLNMRAFFVSNLSSPSLGSFTYFSMSSDSASTNKLVLNSDTVTEL